MTPASSFTPPRPDLDSPEEIAELVRQFYARVEIDDLLRPVFVDQAEVDWETHLPKITAFWCQMELGIPGFDGFPTRAHALLSEETPFRGEQFGRWVGLFHDTVDRGWAGPRAESMKHRAILIAQAQSRLVPTAEPWEPGPMNESLTVGES